MIDLNKTVTLQEILNFCKKYDKYGENQYQENFLEGKSFFDTFVHDIYKIKIENDEFFCRIKTDFNREIDILFNDYNT